MGKGEGGEGGGGNLHFPVGGTVTHLQFLHTVFMFVRVLAPRRSFPEMYQAHVKTVSILEHLYFAAASRVLHSLM